MSTHKNIDKICVVGILIALVIAIVFMNGEKLGIEKIVNEDAEGYAATDYFTSNDLNSASIDFSDSVTITLTEDSARVSGSGAYVYDNEVRIVRSGYYSIIGTTDSYRIVVDAEDYSKVWIQFNGVTINCADDACLDIEQADKVFLVLAEGTENTLISGDTYSDEALEAGHNGTIYAKDDLTITGTGTLTVSTAYKHGIKANDDLAITGGTIHITAEGDGIHANESIRIREAAVAIDAKDEGMQTDEADSFIYIESGTVSVNSSDDGIKSCGTITLDGGNLSITAGDDGIRSDTDIYVNDGVLLINDCYEGIEAKIIEIAGGDITIYPQDDGINANGNSTGMMGMGQGGQPMYEAMQEETAGQINEPSESAEIAANETAETAELDSNGEKPAADTSSALAEQPVDETASVTAAEATSETEETYVRISGGTIRIVNETATDADGIDSNGSVYITGGDIYVSLVGNGSNNAIDYGSESNGIAEISGGTLLASGSYNMAESFDSSSTQASIMYNISSGVEAGTLVTLTDASGNVLLSETVECSFTSIILSTPELQVGGTYTLSFGDAEETITIEEVSASYGDAQSSMFGGTMNFGGMSPRGNRENNGEMPDFSTMEDSDAPQMVERPQNGELPEGFDGQAMRERPEGMQQGMGRQKRPGMNSNEQSATENGTDQQTAPDQGQPAEGMPSEQPEQMQGTMDGSRESMDPNMQSPLNETTEVEADNEAIETETTVSETTKWIMLGASTIGLLAGLLLAKGLKGKSIFS